MSGARDAANLEAGRLLFARECKFVAGTTTMEAMPGATLPEIAFAGRSNVGKSSLINALVGHAALARVSHTPGRTQQLNFFELGGRVILVDLPGFGFAKAAKRRVRGWTGLTLRYLSGRASLRRVCLLIDARHGAKPTDREFMTQLDKAAVSYQIVLTKVDQLKPKELAERIESMTAELARHPAAHPDIIATSAHGGTGIGNLRAALAALA